MSRVRRVGPLPWYGVAGKSTRRLAATVLAGQSVAVFLGALVARALAALDTGSPDLHLWLGVGLAVACVLASGLLRRPFGLAVGWLLQVLTLLGGLVVPFMGVVGVMFLALWVGALWLGGQMDRHTSEVDAAWYAEHPEER